MTDHLIELIKRKDRKAQQEFYHRFSTMMFRLVYRYVNNEQDAGCIVNMGFFKLFNKIQEFSFKGEISMVAWMKKIMINEALMFLRQRFTYVLPDENSQEQLQIDNASEEYLTQEDYYQMIRRLPIDLRIVFNLYAVEGFTHKEIADHLNIKEASSRVYLTRARKMLQDYIKQYQITDGKKYH